MIADEFLIGIGIRVFLRAEEQHVFEEVGQSGAIVGILKGTDVDIETGGGLVGLGVGDQDDSQAVGKRQGGIVAGIIRALDDLFCPKRRRDK